MKNIKKILFCAVIMILALFTNVEAHNKNVTGYSEKNQMKLFKIMENIMDIIMKMGKDIIIR